MFQIFEKENGPGSADDLRALAQSQPEQFASMWRQYRENMHKRAEDQQRLYFPCPLVHGFYNVDVMSDVYDIGYSVALISCF